MPASAATVCCLGRARNHNHYADHNHYDERRMRLEHSNYDYM